MNGMDATGEIKLIADELNNITNLHLHYAQSYNDNVRCLRVRSLGASPSAAREKRSVIDVLEGAAGPYAIRSRLRLPCHSIHSSSVVLAIALSQVNGIWSRISERNS